MSGGDAHEGGPRRVRAAVRHKERHVGYLTTVDYPGRDLAAFPEGTPHAEYVVSDLAERHVALLQRFKQHWLVHCGGDHATTTEGGELTAEQITKLAVFSLEHANTAGDVLVAVLKIGVEKMLEASRDEDQDEDEDE
jgi:hypothetical protein